MSESVLYIHHHAIGRDSKKIFKDTAVSKKDIRENKKRTHNACQQCHHHDGEEGVTLRQCSQCKAVWYCSKEVSTCNSSLPGLKAFFQVPKETLVTLRVKVKVDILNGFFGFARPEHKKHCQFSEGEGITKIVQNFTANDVLNEYLQAIFIQTFPALLDSPTQCLSTAFVARVDIGFEPVDIPDFFRIFNHELDAPDPRKAPVRGMLQLNGFTALCSTTGFGLRLEDLARTRRMVWESVREEGGAADPSEPVAIVELGRGNLGQQITFALPISKAASYTVRQASPWNVQSAITGRVTQTSFSIDSCLEFINSHIRADKQNRFSLRTNLLQQDVQVIHDASNNDPPSRGAQLLRARMAKERIFKPVAMPAIARNGKIVPISPAGRMAID
ncbi:MYND-type domain-containing protein [Mycena indigotica]|uniref:MYND-type domain-containing protein n=1 Tax=Mycena indigotica TaxID=2126181 RepID=A0A8H6SE48_9AGAR|nr:MYND-type domain-containing protein [Mycena indigotica]KAF7297071.1 MYND-type domain-containing protein [Mycena indigotica]